MDDMPEKRLTYAEAAAYTGVSERTLRVAYSSGDLAGFHVGRRREFTTSQLDAYLELLEARRDPHLKS